MATEKPRKRILIMGAAGRDFHNFNVVYRDDPAVEVVAFTAAQIPGIGGRRYPPELAGPLYPQGIPIEDEASLEALCEAHRVQEVVFAYSDVTHETVMHIASRALAAGADYTLLGPAHTTLSSKKPVIAVLAVRTGCGKSQTTLWLSRRIRARGKRVAVLRHPMPYGDLVRERLQRFASLADLDDARCTIEEREEYEPHIKAGNLVFVGVDFAATMAAAEAEADILLWDGGNNDFSFLKPDLHIVVIDALRPDHVTTHHPGEAVARMADIFVINKVDSAGDFLADRAAESARAVNPRASIVRAASPVRLSDPEAVRGRRALVIEDGPTITHGGMPYGAGYVAAVAAGASEIVDPRASAAPLIRQVFERYPHIAQVLPAVGYGDAQIAALEETINGSNAEVVVSATPIDLAARVRLTKPLVRARYEYEDAGEPTLGKLVDAFLSRVLC